MSEATTTEAGAELGVEADDTDATTIVVIGLVSTVLVLCSALGVTALFDSYVSKLNGERVVAATYSEAENALDEQQKTLYGDERFIQETGAYTIKIDRAMDLVVAEMAAAQKESE